MCNKRRHKPPELGRSPSKAEAIIAEMRRFARELRQQKRPPLVIQVIREIRAFIENVLRLILQTRIGDPTGESRDRRQGRESHTISGRATPNAIRPRPVPVPRTKGKALSRRIPSEAHMETEADDSNAEGALVGTVKVSGRYLSGLMDSRRFLARLCTAERVSFETGYDSGFDVFGQLGRRAQYISPVTVIQADRESERRRYAHWFDTAFPGIAAQCRAYRLIHVRLIADRTEPLLPSHGDIFMLDSTCDYVDDRPVLALRHARSQDDRIVLLQRAFPQSLGHAGSLQNELALACAEFRNIAGAKGDEIRAVLDRFSPYFISSVIHLGLSGSQSERNLSGYQTHLDRFAYTASIRGTPRIYE